MAEQSKKIRLHVNILHTYEKDRNQVNYFNVAHVVIPKGTMCHLFTYATHHSELLYKDPEKFDTDRFSADNTQRKSPFAFVPFSAGFRNCIGALFILKCAILVRYASKFTAIVFVKI